VHADFAARLVEWGIDSISVNADAIERTRRNVAAAEQRLLLAAARSTIARRTLRRRVPPVSGEPDDGTDHGLAG
jgi:pyruvate,water dikinase